MSLVNKFECLKIQRNNNKFPLDRETVNETKTIFREASGIGKQQQQFNKGGCFV